MSDADRIIPLVEQLTTADSGSALTVPNLPDARPADGAPGQVSDPAMSCKSSLP